MAEERGVAAGIVPAFFLADYYWVGFTETVNHEISATVGRLLTGDAGITGHGLVSGSTPPFPELFRLGRIDTATAPAFIVTVAIAAVDGLNPCSLWVLTFLVGLIVRSGSRRRTLAVGIVYLLVTATVYGLFILGLFSAFYAAGGGPVIRVLVAILAVSMGLVNMKDYFAFRIGFSLAIPARFHSAIAGGGRSILTARDAPLRMAGVTVLFALGVSIVELPCTAGFPMIWSSYIATLGISQIRFAALFTLYLIVYLGLEIMVVAASILFMKRLVFREAHARLLKLCGGTIMVALGVAYLGFPGMTQTIDGVGVILGLASGLSVLIILLDRLSRGRLDTRA